MVRNSARRTAGQPQVTFWGAAQSVTGSLHVVEFGGQHLLLDCGLYRGPREHRPPSDQFPLPPQSVSAVVLSHAHVDHCGRLLDLVRAGYHGPIFCTGPTRELTALMLADSARLREEDARVGANRSGELLRPSGPPRHEPVEQVLSQCESVSYGQTVEVMPGVRLCLLDAGHVLGSAMILLTFATRSGERRLLYTGDLGRRQLPLLAGPAPVPMADLVICESTYGGRIHEPPEQVALALRDLVDRTLSRGGKVLVPAFSLGRTQIVVRALQQALADANICDVPIHVDSRLAADIAAVYRRHRNWLKEDLERPDGPPVRYLQTREEGEELSLSREPYVVVASGGMCDGGRILTHLKRHIDDPRCSLVLVSYQAPHTLGRRLLDRGPTVRFHGRTWNKWIEVVHREGFSAHADQGEILAELAPRVGQVHAVRLVHGEIDQAEALAAALRQKGFGDVAGPARGDTVTVG